MKQKIYILGVITSLIIFTGTIFKIEHWAGAAILLIAGLIALVVLVIPVALINHYKSTKPGQNLLLYLITGLTCFVVFTGMLFKILHWPGASLLLLIGLPFPYVVFLPVFIWVTSKDRNFNIYSIVFVLALLAFNAVFSTLLSLNPSKVRIDDSYNLSRNYNNMVKAMVQIPDRDPKTIVDQRIDEAVKMIEEYQELFLKFEGISLEQWKTKAGNLVRPDVPAIAAAVLLKEEGKHYGSKLETLMKNLIREMENSKGYENLYKAAPELLDFSVPAEGNPTWSEKVFRDNTLSWALIYLDALKADLLSLKNQVLAVN
jgi:hypothetical protein